MDKATVIREVKRLIGKAELERALDHLAASFQQNAAQYQDLENTLLQIRMQLNRIRQDEARALINREDAQFQRNQIAEQLIRLLQDFENTQEQVGTNKQGKNNRNRLIVVLALLGLAVVATVIMRFGGSSNNQNALLANPDHIEVQAFSSEALFNTLIFPFKPAVGSFNTIHEDLMTRMGIVADLANVDIDTKVFPLDPNSDSYPNKSVDAEKLVENWDADLIIWGSTYQEKEQTTILTRYKFLTDNEYFKFHKLSMDELDGSLVDTITTISSIATDGVLTDSIEHILLGVLAFMQGDYQAVAAILENTHPKDSIAIIMRGMILAESYLEMDKREDAIQAYNEVLKKHPNYGLARNNRGMLEFSLGNYGDAIDDLNVSLAINKENENARVIRAQSYEHLGLLAKAAEDYKTVADAHPETTTVAALKLKDVEEKTKKQRGRLSEATKMLRKSPKDKEALETIVDAAVKVGEYTKAEEQAQLLLEIDPSSIPAYANKIKAQIVNEKFDEARAVFEQARSKGLDSSELVKAVPMLHQLFNNSQKKD